MRVKTEFERTGRLNISARDEKELAQRIEDLELRGYVVKQIIEPKPEHFQDYYYGERDKRRREKPHAKYANYRAVMVKKEESI